jgi:hypothetical protein
VPALGGGKEGRAQAGARNGVRRGAPRQRLQVVLAVDHAPLHNALQFGN